MAETKKIQPTQNLYVAYKKFMLALYGAQKLPNRGRKIMNFKEFCLWWSRLDGDTQNRMQGDYNLGYEKSVGRATKKIDRLTQHWVH